MTTGEAKLKITADTSQASREMRNLQGSIDATSGSVGGFTNATSSLQPRVEKAATAISGMASVFGGVGQKAGAAFGAVSNLAAAFITGGPLLAGIAAATTGVAFLVQEMTSAEEASKKLAQETEKNLAKALELVQQRAKDAEEALRNFGKTGTQIALDRNKVEQQQALLGIGAGKNAARATQAAFEATNFRKDLSQEEAAAFLQRAGAEGREQFGEEGQVFLALFKAQKAAQIQAEFSQKKLKELAKEEAALTALIKKQNSARRTAARIDRDRSQAAQRRGTVGVAPMYGLGTGGIEAEFNKVSDLDKRVAQERSRELAQAFTDFDKASKAAIELKEKEEQEKLRLAKAAADEEASYRMSKAQEAASVASGLAMQGFDLVLNVVEAGISGQTEAIGAMVAQFVRGIGQQLMGIGLKYIFEGAGMAAASAGTNPAAYATMAVGAGALGIGTGMAVSGTVAGAAMARAQLSSAGGGRGASTSGGSSGPGVGGGGGGFAGQGGGNVSLNFSGGTFLGDPTERARNLRRDQLRASRTVFTPGG